MTVSTTRIYRFAASHRLHTSALSDAENARVFGKCNNPYGHGHDYELRVTVQGNVDALSGLIVPPNELDQYVQSTVLRRVANRNLNLDVAEFQELIPTTENLTAVVANLLESGWTLQFGTAGPRLARVHIQETPRNGFGLIVATAGETQESL